MSYCLLTLPSVADASALTEKRWTIGVSLAVGSIDVPSATASEEMTVCQKSNFASARFSGMGIEVEDASAFNSCDLSRKKPGMSSWLLAT